MLTCGIHIGPSLLWGLRVYNERVDCRFSIPSPCQLKGHLSRLSRSLYIILNKSQLTMRISSSLPVLAAVFCSLAQAQFPPPPEGVTTIISKDKESLSWVPSALGKPCCDFMELIKSAVGLIYWWLAGWYAHVTLLFACREIHKWKRMLKTWDYFKKTSERILFMQSLFWFRLESIPKTEIGSAPCPAWAKSLVHSSLRARMKMNYESCCNSYESSIDRRELTSDQVV